VEGATPEQSQVSFTKEDVGRFPDTTVIQKSCKAHRQLPIKIHFTGSPLKTKCDHPDGNFAVASQV
jgi:hypothetical protein